jgi:Zn-dependent protease
VPPLDGSKVLAYLLPREVAYRFGQLEKYGPLLLMVLIFTGRLSPILQPLAISAINAIWMLASTISGIF